MTPYHSALVDAWTQFRSDSRPHLLSGDELLSERYRGRSLSVTHDSYETYVGGDDFNDRKSRILHTGLIPIPYLGDLINAKIFILMLNPGIGDHDYFAEYHYPPYRMELMQNLRQHLNKDYPMLFLNPAYSWHGGGQYWISRLRPFIELIVKKEKCTFREAMRVLSRSVCCLELLPYHSASYSIPGTVLKNLRSVALIRNFVRNDLVRRASEGRACIIAARGNSLWGVPASSRNVATLSSSEARRANLSISSPAGKLIRRFLSL